MDESGASLADVAGFERVGSADLMMRVANLDNWSAEHIGSDGVAIMLGLDERLVFAGLRRYLFT